MIKDYCLGFAFNMSHVLLIEKQKPDWQKGKLNGLGGLIEPRETSMMAMAREFEEECGIKTAPEDWSLFARLDIGLNECRVYCFKAFLDITKAKTTTGEKIKLVHIDELQLQARISNLDWLIPLAVDENIPNLTVAKYL